MHVITHFNPFITGKIEKLDFWDANKNINPRTTRAKSINLHTIRKLIEYSLKNVLVKAIFTPSVFEILMHEGRSVLKRLSGAQGTKGLKFQWKSKKIFWICWNCLKSGWLTNLGGFQWFLIFFWFCLTLSLPGKLKNSIFEMPIIPQTLNINNSRTTRAKSINLHTVRNLTEYSLKNAPIKTMLTSTISK